MYIHMYIYISYIDIPEQYSVYCLHEYDFQQIGDSDTLFVSGM